MIFSLLYHAETHGLWPTLLWLKISCKKSTVNEQKKRWKYNFFTFGPLKLHFPRKKFILLYMNLLKKGESDFLCPKREICWCWVITFATQLVKFSHLHVKWPKNAIILFAGLFEYKLDENIKWIYLNWKWRKLVMGRGFKRFQGQRHGLFFMILFKKLSISKNLGSNPKNLFKFFILFV